MASKFNFKKVLVGAVAIASCFGIAYAANSAVTITPDVVFGNDGDIMYVLRDDGKVASIGYGATGKLDVFDTDTPVLVSGLTSVRAVAAGLDAAYALRTTGTIYAWGSNTYGQLGNNSDEDSDTIVQVKNLTKVTAIAAHQNADTAYALRSTGLVYAWGAGGDGQLGNGTDDDSPVPVQVKTIKGIVKIYADEYTAYAMTSTGLIYGWGAEILGPTKSSNTPVLIKSLDAIPSR